MAAKHPTSFSLAILVIANILLCHQAAAARGGPDFGICKGADYKRLCRATVRGAASADIASQLAMQALLTRTQRAKGAIAKAGNNKFTSVCSSSYNNAIDNLQQSMGFLKTRDTGSLMSYLSASLTSYVNCDDAYAEFGKTSPFAATNKHLVRMASNCLYLASMVH